MAISEHPTCVLFKSQSLLNTINNKGSNKRGREEIGSEFGHWECSSTLAGKEEEPETIQLIPTHSAERKLATQQDVLKKAEQKNLSEEHPSKEYWYLELLSELLWGKQTVVHHNKRPRVSADILEKHTTFTFQPIQVIKSNLMYPFPVLKVPHYSGFRWMKAELDLYSAKFGTSWEPHKLIPQAVRSNQPECIVLNEECHYVFDHVKFNFDSDRRMRFYMLKISFPEINWSVWTDPFSIVSKPKWKLPEEAGNNAECGTDLRRDLILGNINVNRILYKEKKEMTIHGNFPTYPNYMVRLGNREFVPKKQPTRNTLAVDIWLDETCKQKKLDVTVLVKNTTIEVTKSKCITLECGWQVKRLLWIGMMKNEGNRECCFGSLPKDMIKEIQTFL